MEGWTALICPRCGAGLPTAAQRRLFVCAACGARSCVSSGSAEDLRELPLHVLRPRELAQPSAPVVLLPVWLVRPDRDTLGTMGLRLPPQLCIPALGLERGGLLLQFARNLSRAIRDIDRLNPARDLHPEPGEIGPEDALHLAELVALRHIDGWPPAEEAQQLEIPLTMTTLVDWPCQLRGGDLIDLLSGIAAPATLLGASSLRDQGQALQNNLRRVSMATSRPIPRDPGSV